MTGRTVDITLEFPRLNTSTGLWPRSRPMVAEALRDLVETRWGAAVRHTTWVLHGTGELQFRFQLLLPGSTAYPDIALQTVLNAWWEDLLHGSSQSAFPAPAPGVLPLESNPSTLTVSAGACAL